LIQSAAGCAAPADGNHQLLILLDLLQRSADVGGLVVDHGRLDVGFPAKEFKASFGMLELNVTS
jgi:hypothetical protein